MIGSLPLINSYWKGDGSQSAAMLSSQAQAYQKYSEQLVAQSYNFAGKSETAGCGGALGAAAAAAAAAVAAECTKCYSPENSSGGAGGVPGMAPAPAPIRAPLVVTPTASGSSPSAPGQFSFGSTATSGSGGGGGGVVCDTWASAQAHGGHTDRKRRSVQQPQASIHQLRPEDFGTGVGGLDAAAAHYLFSAAGVGMGMGVTAPSYPSPYGSAGCQGNGGGNDKMGLISPTGIIRPPHQHTHPLGRGRIPGKRGRAAGSEASPVQRLERERIRRFANNTRERYEF